MLRPTLAVRTLEQLDPARLRRMGAKCLVLDKDDTLCPHLGLAPSPHLEPVLSYLFEAFQGQVYLLSNSRQLLENQWAGLKVLKTKRRKPFNMGEVLAILREEDPKLLSGEICVVGDRLLTDVLGANLAGSMSVLVGGFGYSLRTHGAGLCSVLAVEGLLKRRYLMNE